MPTSPPPPPSGSVDPVVGNAIVNSYFPLQLASPETARSRAQNGYTIAAAVAAAIVAAGVFGDFTSAVFLVKLLGIVALLLWLIAAGAFIHVATGKTDPLKGTAPDLTAASIAIVQHARKERETIDGWAKDARRLTYAAMAVTAAALGFAALKPHKNANVHANVLLAPGGTAAMARLCATPTDVIKGTVDPSSLGHKTIKVLADEGQCGDGKATMHLLGKDVLAIVQGGRIAAQPKRALVQVELSSHGRRVLQARLGPRCREDDLHGLAIAGPRSTPVVLAFARTGCRRLRVRITPSLGAVYYLP